MNVLRRLLLFIVLGSMAFAADEPLNASQAAERVVIPKLQFMDSDIREAAEAIQQISWRLTKQPKRLNVVVALKPGPPRPPVTFTKENATMMALLKEVAERAGCEVQGEGHALVIRDKGAGPLPPITAGEGVDLPSVRARLDTVIFPRVDFRDATAREAIEFIVQKMKQLSPNGPDMSLKLQLGGRAQASELPPPAAAVGGIPGLPGNPKAAPAPLAHGRRSDPSRITLQASNIPYLELLRYVAGSVDLKVTVEKFGILVEPVKTE